MHDRPTFRAPAFVRFVVWLPLFTLRGRRQHGLLANIPYNNQRGRKRFGKVQQEENGGKAILLDPLAIVPSMSAGM